MKRLFLLTVLFSLLSPLRAQINFQEKLENDPGFTIGRLENGITYYLRHNEEPKERASFYIIRNAGALLETDEQNGLAHFLEHMAFNGTKNFPGKGIISGLEKHGVAFGRNINAYTAHNETVYNLSDVPTTNPSLLDTCLLILHDWSYYLTLDGKEIDEERGVITEEWRSRRNAKARIAEQTRPVLFRGSKYAERDVIGSLDVIQHFPHQLIRDFYHKWYRTDLEAIAVVGDINVKEMEAKIKQLFSTIPAIPNPEPRPFFDVPEHDETYYVLATDKEVTQSSLSVSIFLRDTLTAEQKATPAFLRDITLISFYNQMAARRLHEIVQQPDAPFLSASLAAGGFVPGYTSYNIAANARPHAETRAFEAVLAENERILRYGFTEDELAIVKTNTLAGLETAYKQRDKLSNEAYMKDIKANFLEGSVMIPFEKYYDLMKQLVPSITAADVSALAHRWDTARNRTLTITGPVEGEEHLTKEQMLAIIDRVKQADIQPYQYQTTAAVLMEQLPDPGRIVATRSLPRFDATEWTLQNGARVIFRHADYEKESVVLSSFSWGGTSLYDVDMLPAAEQAASLTGTFGLGQFDPLTLQKVLAGKQVSCTASISGISESVQATSTPKDLETMFQLVYLQFEQPRFDPALYQTLMNRYRISLERSKGQPQQQMKDSVRLIMSDYHPRTLLFNEQYLDAITLERIEQVYCDRIHDASDFTFFLVGNVSEEEVRPLVERYIGALKSDYRKEMWRDNRVFGPKGRIEKVIALDLPTPKSTIMTHFSTSALKQTVQNNLCLDILKGILQLRYTENIREKEGGTYGVNVQSGATRRPRSIYSLSMQFECDPDKAAYLKSLLYTETDKLMQEAPTQEELDKVTANLRNNYEQSKLHNNYWMNVLQNYYVEGRDLTDPKNFETVLDKLTVKDIQAFAKKLFRKADVVDLTFCPKKN